MTPKEKAENLYELFVKILPDSGDISKQDIQQCALVAVDEILNVAYFPSVIDFFKQVKQEIEKL